MIALLLLLLALTLAPPAHADSLTCAAGSAVTFTCGATTPPPPGGVTCPDGSQHPAGYTCPQPPPATITCDDGSVHNLPYSCPLPPAGFNGVCPGFDGTVYFADGWGFTSRVVVESFGPHDALVIRIAPPSTVPPSSTNPNGGIPTYSLGEFSGGPITRVTTISATPCDWSKQSAYYANSSGSAPRMSFYVGDPGAAASAYYPWVNPGGTIYLNFKDAPNTSAVERVFIDFSKPVFQQSGMTYSVQGSQAAKVSLKAHYVNAAKSKTKKAKPRPKPKL